MGIASHLKFLAPVTIYVVGLAYALLAMGGKTRGALMLIAFLLPLRNITDKVQALPFGNQFIDILALGVIIGGMFHSKQASDSKVPDKSSITPIALITVIYVFLSLLWSGIYLYGGFYFSVQDPRVQDWKNFSLMPLLFFLNFKNNTTKKEVWAMFALMCLPILISDFYTINQIREHPTLVGRDQIRGTFEFLGPNEVAAFLNEYTLILLSVLYALRKSGKKLLLFGLILINLYCITFLYSRGAYLGLIAGLLILFSFRDQKMLIPVFLVLILWQTVLPQNVIDRIKQTETSTGQLDASAQGRLDMWKDGMDLFDKNPIIGIGFGSFRNMGFDLLDTHNIYVKILTEQGLVGMIIFLITIVCFLKEGWTLYQKGDDQLSKAMGLGFVCCVFVMLVNNFFGNRWAYLEPNAYLWIYAGLVSRLKVIAQNPPPKDEEPAAAQAPVAPKSKPGKYQQFQEKKKKFRYYDPPQAK